MAFGGVHTLTHSTFVPRARGGFTLLETLVALVIASLALAVLYHAGAAALNSVHTAARYREAMARAQSRLALATHGGALAPGDWQGDDDGGFHWRLHVEPVTPAVPIERDHSAGVAGASV